MIVCIMQMYKIVNTLKYKISQADPKCSMFPVLTHTEPIILNFLFLTLAFYFD